MHLLHLFTRSALNCIISAHISVLQLEWHRSCPCRVPVRAQACIPYRREHQSPAERAPQRPSLLSLEMVNPDPNAVNKKYVLMWVDGSFALLFLTFVIAIHGYNFTFSCLNSHQCQGPKLSYSDFKSTNGKSSHIFLYLSKIS